MGGGAGWREERDGVYRAAIRAAVCLARDARRLAGAALPPPHPTVSGSPSGASLQAGGWGRLLRDLM